MPWLSEVKRVGAWDLEEKGVKGRKPAKIMTGMEVWTVTKSGPMEAPVVDIKHPLEGYPWGSSCGYQTMVQVT